LRSFFTGCLKEMNEKEITFSVKEENQIKGLLRALYKMKVILC